MFRYFFVFKLHTSAAFNGLNDIAAAAPQPFGQLRTHRRRLVRHGRRLDGLGGSMD